METNHDRRVDVSKTQKIAVVGLGYVGLPLAIEFGKQFDVIGFDIDTNRIKELRLGHDRTREVPLDVMKAHGVNAFTSEERKIYDCDTYIVAVPTPVDAHKCPDLGPLKGATAVVGRALEQGNLVVYESTVFPGATEDICVPILEESSGLRFNQGFYCGYSPERVNPGDKEHDLISIKKVVAGSTPEVAKEIELLYGSIILAGTHVAESIRVAEAAKVIENIQRDVNIALINEFAIIFNRLGIDTKSVLDAAATKWNFFPFQPGLVGGHCIGVDPYYLTHKAVEVGYHPEMILAGRRINDGMAQHVVTTVSGIMLDKAIQAPEPNILILGLSFKENCPDIRNTRVIDLLEGFQGYGYGVDIYDPWVDPEVALAEYGLRTIQSLVDETYDAIVIAVPHRDFIALGIEKIRAFGKPQCVVFDIKGAFPRSETDGRL